jgi:hypothetical protein
MHSLPPYGTSTGHALQVGSDVAARTQAAASQTAEAAKEKAGQAYGAAADTAARTQQAAQVGCSNPCSAAHMHSAQHTPT